MIKNKIICAMIILSVSLGASTEPEVVHYPITNALVTSEQVKVFAGIDVKFAYHYPFYSCDQQGFQDFLQKVGNNDHAQVAKAAVALMIVCQKATQKDSSFSGYLATGTVDDFKKINFHIDLPVLCDSELKKAIIDRFGSIIRERTLINVQGEGTVIARPTLQEYKNFISSYCSNYSVAGDDSERYHFEKNEELKPGQSIRFSKAECIHAGPKHVDGSRILMIFDHIKIQPVSVDVAL